LTIAQQEDLRKACLEFLALRYPNAYVADAIARMLARRQVVDFPVGAADVMAALTWLAEEGFAKTTEDDGICVIPAWQSTARGAAKHQRKQIAADPANAEGL
jgi:hypothetical protein